MRQVLLADLAEERFLAAPRGAHLFATDQARACWAKLSAVCGQEVLLRCLFIEQPLIRLSIVYRLELDHCSWHHVELLSRRANIIDLNWYAVERKPIIY